MYSPKQFRRANAVLEAVLVLPILVGLAFGTVEFGHFFYIKHSLQGAARQGARAAIPSSATNADVANAVASSMSLSGLQNSGYTITTNPPDISTAADGANVSVTVQCTWGNVGVRALGVIRTDKCLRGAAVMRREGA